MQTHEQQRKRKSLKNILQGDRILFFKLLTVYENCDKRAYIDRLPQKYMLCTCTAALTRNIHEHMILSSSDVMAV